MARLLRAGAGRHDADVPWPWSCGGCRGWYLRCSWRPVLASSGGGDLDQPGGRV